MAKKIDRFEFNKDLDKYVGKVSKSNNRFINLNDFIKKEKKSVEKTDTEKHDPELIELKEKKGFSLFLSRILDVFKTPEDDEEELKESEDITEQIKESDDEIEEDVEEHFEEEVKKKPKCCFIKNLFSNNEVEKLKESNENLLYDLKAVSVFAKDLLEIVPKENLDELKMDGSIDEFKNILKKNNILKKE